MVTRPKHRTRIKAQKTGDFLPFNSSHTAARLGLPLKPSIILIRWPVVIIASYLLLYPSTRYLPESFFHAFILLYVISNVALYFLDDPWFGSWSFYYPLVITDTLVLTMSLIINGRAETDFYFTFFLLVIASCILEDAKLRAAVSLLAPVVYLGLRFQSGENIDPSIYLRLPFLFVVSLFYGYFTQFIRTEKALREDAEKRNQGKKEMLDIVSHEFRTPLNLIDGYAQALKSKTLGELTKEQERVLAKILGQSGNLLYLANSVLDLTRIEAGQMSVEREVIELPEYLREMRLRYETPLDKPVLLKWSVAADLPAISSDRGKLTIVLQNLINNAVKFTEEGTITLRHDGQETSGGWNLRSRTQALAYLKKPSQSFLINSAKRTARQPESMGVLALDFTSSMFSPIYSEVPSTWKPNRATGPFSRFGCQHDGGRFKKWSKSVRRTPDLVGA